MAVELQSLTGWAANTLLTESGSAMVWKAYNAAFPTFIATPTSANLASLVSDETGSGALVFANTPTLVTPVLGTPTSGTLTNCTGLPIATGVSGLGTGIATFLATPSSANLISAITNETGSGALVFGTSPTLTTPVINVGSDATGDIYYRNSGGAFTRLAVGTNGHVLTLASGLPSWAAPGGGGSSYNESNPIYDSSTNELLKFAKTTSAVNEFTITNNATGSAPIFGATGGDTNIDIVALPKGSGKVRFATSSQGFIYESSGLMLGYGSTDVMRIDSNFHIRYVSSNHFGWTASTPTSGFLDTAFRRHSAGVIATTKGWDGTTYDNFTSLIGGGASVASASALPLPTGRVFHVTGTTNITSITATNFQSGVVITLIFDGVLTFTDGNNLKLAGNFVTTADDTITLVYDSGNFYEIARSVN